MSKTKQDVIYALRIKRELFRQIRIEAARQDRTAAEFIRAQLKRELEQRAEATTPPLGGASKLRKPLKR